MGATFRFTAPTAAVLLRPGWGYGGKTDLEFAKVCFCDGAASDFQSQGLDPNPVRLMGKSKVRKVVARQSHRKVVGEDR